MVLQKQYSSECVNFSYTKFSDDCNWVISVEQLHTELGLLGGEPYYMIYPLDPRGRLSGEYLLGTAIVPAIMITTERLKAQTVKERESVALWDCREHKAAYALTSGKTLWTVLRDLASQHHTSNLACCMKQVGRLQSCSWVNTEGILSFVL